MVSHPSFLFRFLKTRRPEEDILSLETLSSVHSITIDQQPEESIQDFPRYIKYELGVLRPSNMLKVPSDWPWDESLRIPSQAENVLFIWADSAVKFISEERLD